MARKTLIVVVGPTAVGKTGLAIRLAIHFQTEIVSADSRQIYKELEVGTAKPLPDELNAVKHHFINTKSVEEEYDAGTYGLEASQVIDSLFKQHDLVILCGGSGLYVKSIIEGFDDLPEIPDTVRKQVRQEYDSKGLSWLQQEVALQDPEYYEVVDRKNPQRLMRALEVIRGSGQPFSGYHSKNKADLPFDVLKIGLELERPVLYEKIDNRMDEMIRNGLFEEAERFFNQRHLNALQTVGYREIFGFLEGAYGKEEAIRLLKRNSRHYAKRQLTWFRKDSDIHWFKPDDWQGIVNYIDSSIKLKKE
ncbi:MAG TPA: tRNA (adenosine(37)-N6)-dimethylallyltransferase MiaA [Cyclobacteriaceae bacterium]|nr:tRNA (adenosine(37)-N6)-dimethylallyltransferase MiaA [Cyclobacteriaceae bacterium]